MFDFEEYGWDDYSMVEGRNSFVINKGGKLWAIIENEEMVIFGKINEPLIKLLMDKYNLYRVGNHAGTTLYIRKRGRV